MKLIYARKVNVFPEKSETYIEFLQFKSFLSFTSRQTDLSPPAPRYDAHYFLSSRRGLRIARLFLYRGR